MNKKLDQTYLTFASCFQYDFSEFLLSSLCAPLLYAFKMIPDQFRVGEEGVYVLSRYKDFTALGNEDCFD